VAVRWWSHGMTRRRWWRRGSQPPGRGDRDGPRVPPHRRWQMRCAPSRRCASRGGNRGPETACSPVRAVAVMLVIASRCEATRAASRHSVRACRER
jgi:hypothetical protein